MLQGIELKLKKLLIIGQISYSLKCFFSKAMELSGLLQS